MLPISLTALDDRLNQLEDKCSNYLEGAQDHPDSPPVDELEIAAIKIHDACLPVLELIETCEAEEERAQSSLSFESQSVGSPEGGTRRFSFSSNPLSPLKISVSSLCHTTQYFQPLAKERESHRPKELFISSKQTVAILRGVLSELRGFDKMKPPLYSPSSRAFVSVDPTLEVAATCSYDLPKARIAVCDDEKACRRILGKLLVPLASHDIASFDSISSLRDFLIDRGDEIDLLFLDNDLGDGTGWDFILEMRAHPSWSKIFVVLITSTSTFNLPDAVEKTKMLWDTRGFDAFLGKPTSIKEIKEALSENFQRVRSTSESRTWIKR